VKQGLYNIPMGRYLAAPELARSGLIKFEAQMGLRKKGKDYSPEMSTGTLCHTVVLEPEQIDQIVAMPAMNPYKKPPEKQTKFVKSGKDWVRFQEENPGKQIISAGDYETAKRVFESIYENPEHEEAADLLTGGNVEVSGFYEYTTPDGSVVQLKCRPDALKPGIVINLKTTADATPAFQQRHFYDMCYHWSLFFELEGLTAITGKPHNIYKFVCVETTPPYGVMIYELPREYRNIAEKEIIPSLELYASMKEKNQKPHYPRGTQMLYPPNFARKTTNK